MKQGYCSHQSFSPPNNPLTLKCVILTKAITTDPILLLNNAKYIFFYISNYI